MEDDDEFGDLYTDVLMPFSSSAAPPLSHPPPTPHLHRPIDSNHHSRYGYNTLLGAPVSIPDAQTLAPFKFHPTAAPAASLTSIPKRDGSAPEPMVLDFKQEPADGNDVLLDIEDGGSNAIEGSGSDDPIIPGLTESVRQGDSGRNDDGNDNGIEGGGQVEAGGGGEGDDGDSDSEDDLQIVLNDNNHRPISMERGGMMAADDDDDEDGDPLVIVADGDANQGTEEQNWGEGGGQAAGGEGKEGGEVGKVGTPGSSGGIVIAPKIGYSSHGFHPFHSQFKVSVLSCRCCC
ncbi:hypothetical protein F3Y22_tig00117048pilonHSYRG00840 [Hibiscus syriacus]|uniref:Uncharacterized protein n=1 Tax=Hibiscus syriacus TaxID=106335 RepID=A0A6A2WY26_HIBSY|nr:hypothetical protein F3Y22_tig00117048pilonHSYRG00840 [Hibiscus syriacus]